MPAAELSRLTLNLVSVQARDGQFGQFWEGNIRWVVYIRKPERASDSCILNESRGLIFERDKHYIREQTLSHSHGNLMDNLFKCLSWYFIYPGALIWFLMLNISFFKCFEMNRFSMSVSFTRTLPRCCNKMSNNRTPKTRSKYIVVSLQILH